jgi:hypothetical protein
MEILVTSTRINSTVAAQSINSRHYLTQQATDPLRCLPNEKKFRFQEMGQMESTRLGEWRNYEHHVGMQQTGLIGGRTTPSEPGSCNECA